MAVEGDELLMNTKSVVTYTEFNHLKQSIYLKALLITLKQSNNKRTCLSTSTSRFLLSAILTTNEQSTHHNAHVVQLSLQQSLTSFSPYDLIQLHHKQLNQPEVIVLKYLLVTLFPQWIQPL